MTSSPHTLLRILCVLILVTTSLLYAGDARAARPATAAQSAKQFDRSVRDRVDSGRSTGIVAGMVLPDGSTRVVAYGDAGQGRRLNRDSIFEIGSITKTFTATLLAEMAQRGDVRLSDPVATLLPGVPVPARGARQITLLDLATQTSGLPRLPDNLRHPLDSANPYAGYTPDDLYTFLRGYKLTRAPGDGYEYSNLGVGLLGHALALRGGRSYEDLLRERVLAPLGMASTAIAMTPALAPRFADGHDPHNRVTAHWDLPTLEGAGALRSSMTDMLTYAAANLDGNAGPLARVLAAARAPRLPITPHMKIGLIWNTLRIKGRDIVWHDGGTGGFSSFIGLDEARRTAVVVLANSTREPVEDIGFHALDPRVALEPARKAILLGPAVLRRYVGTYDAGITVTRSGHHLVLDVPGLGSAPLYPETKTRFFLRVLHGGMTFKVAKHGRVVGAALRTGYETVELRKVA